MKKKTVWITAAIIGLGALAVVLALAFTHWNKDGKKDRRTVPQYTLEELENADITATEATNADSNESAGTTLNNDQWEELAESLFQAIRFWSSLDDMSHEEARLSHYDRIERWRKEHKLENDDMTKIFAKTIQDYFLEREKKSDNKKLKTWHSHALFYIKYYPLPRKEFMELVHKTVELEPEYANKIISSYISAYPDWVFDDKPIIEIIDKTDSETYRFSGACVDLINQILKERDETRKKKLLDKAFEWSLQDDMHEIFQDLDRILLDHYDKDYATNPRRKLQLEKDLKRHEEARKYTLSYLRSKYALEHFGEGDEALEVLYKLDMDDKVKSRILEKMNEIKKAGKDPSAIISKKYLEEIYSDE